MNSVTEETQFPMDLGLCALHLPLALSRCRTSRLLLLTLNITREVQGQKSGQSSSELQPSASQEKAILLLSISWLFHCLGQESFITRSI